MPSESVSKLDRIATAVLTCATVIALGLLIEKRFNPPAPAGNRVEYDKGWRESIAKASQPLGATAGPVKVAVYTDFQCPFCSRMDSALTAIEAKHPGKITRSAIHFPVVGHEFARPAAAAFVCASEQGRAAEMHHVLYKGQSVFGKHTWVEFASDAGIADTARFAACLERNPAETPIARGIALAEVHRVQGTPTVIVNGWIFDPSLTQAIERAVVAAIDGKSPKP